MHTNSALQSVTRLVDIGVEPFLVAPSIIAVMAQRLVKQICPSCKTPYAAERELVEQYFTSTEGEQVVFWKGAGCDRCGNTGFFGRVAIHELFVITQEVRELIAHGATSGEIHAAAMQGGFRSMRYDGLKKVLRGLTTIDQIEAVACLDENVGGSRPAS
jgi:type IV pilus assembly protein PilB